ncbi:MULTISPECIES: GNAT family N-acetyltransferase [unclassified Methylocystis]|uniref:GNAT family N-acetyltransferase n=1 Tax=unclassified Methylocystis TaxID=2625913 RepID=UPI0019243AF3|nr:MULTISPECIES: GNAT family protein [unclassified Methylocystis]MBL1257863.1 GNAT family N-acetyltransferase [Methylocystis sp. Sn-Cys]MDJ0450770.1 GNAT family protein [Methylocystis sp. JR02]
MSLQSIPTLRGPDMLLREFRAGDARERFELGNDPAIMRMFGVDPTDIPALTEAGVRRWVDDLAKHPLAWAIEHEGSWLGEIRLDNMNKHDRRAQLAIGLYDPHKLGRGLGRRAILILLRYAFDALALHRISVRVVSYNGRAIACYRACGFVEEGREREAARVGDEWRDDVIMGLLAHEFDSSQ